jgi:hypothetical protein
VLNRPGIAELRGHGDVVQHGVVSFLGFGRRDISDGLQQSPVVEPVHPFQLSELNGFKGSPRSAPLDHLGFVESVDGLGQSIVVTVTDAADRRLYAGFGEPFRVFDRDILAAAIAVVDQPATVDRSADRAKPAAGHPGQSWRGLCG